MTDRKRWRLENKMPKGARLYSLSQPYGNITMIQLERSAFEWPGQMGFAPPEVEKSLDRNNETKTQVLAVLPTYQNDEQVDYLLWVSCNIQDEGICDLWWRCNNNNDLHRVNQGCFQLRVT